MYAVFIDEAGFSWNWKEEVDQQPFYVLSAVMLPMDKLASTYNALRERVNELKIPGLDSQKLGRGIEIKAKDVDSGQGYWHNNEEHRNQVRDLFLSAPSEHGGNAIVVVVDKQAHIQKYVDPQEPHDLALQFLFERLQSYLEEKNSECICFFDRTTRDEFLINSATKLTMRGSHITYWSQFYSNYVEKWLPIPRILEFYIQDSKYSLGIQIADFFARYTYSKRKSGRDDYSGWDLIEQSLYKRDGKLKGFGYKEFPADKEQ